MMMQNNRANLTDQKPDLAEEDFNDSLVFEWDADEFIYYEKGKNWVWALVVAAIIFVVIFVLLKNYLGIGITVLLAIVVYQYAFKKPKVMHYVLTRDGLLVGDKLFEFKDLKSYWISAEGVLHVETKKYIPPQLSIILTSLDIDSLDRFLAHYISRVSPGEGGSSDDFSRWLRL